MLNNSKALLSHKYGKRLLSDNIEATEFEKIKKEIVDNLALNLSVHYENSEDQIEYKIENVFNECYKLDENEKPNYYHLLPISQIVKDYKSAEPHLKNHGNKFWTLIEEKLIDSLRMGAQAAHDKGLLSKEDYERYFISSKNFQINGARFYILNFAL